MVDTCDEELIDVEDLFENEEFVLMKATFKNAYHKIVRVSVGIKSICGDIVRIVTVCEKVKP